MSSSETPNSIDKKSQDEKEQKEQRVSLNKLLRALISDKKFFLIFGLGVSAGLPLMLVFSIVKIWLRRSGIDISTIGYFSLLTIPYSLNFLWAALLDQFYIEKLGRRRTWILGTQALLFLSFLGISFFSPKQGLYGVIIFTFLISLFSSTQDIAIDALRAEIMHAREQGVGSSLYVYGYRIGMLLSSGFGLWMVDPETFGLSFNQMFQAMSLIMLLLVFVTLFINEPAAAGKLKQKNFFNAVVLPFKEFFKRESALVIFFFVLLFKIGDGMASSVYGAYYVDLNLSNKVIAEVTKGVGFFSSMAGLGFGATLIYMFKIKRCLFIFGVFQAVSTGLFALLPLAIDNLGHWVGLGTIVAIEDFSSGLGTTALVAFMSVLVNKDFTATQYALLASLAALGRTFFSSASGKVIELTSISTEDPSYTFFFIFCALIALPGLLLALKIGKDKSIS